MFRLPFFAGRGVLMMRIAVLAGGNSTERAVSLCSGARIANALRRNGHEVLLLDLSGNAMEMPEEPALLFTRKQEKEFSISEILSGNDALQSQQALGEDTVALCRMADCAFLALHGGMGEDGTVQSILDAHQIPYTGSGALGSALAMDKDIAKRLFCQCGIPTPDWTLYDAQEKSFSRPPEEIGFPCVVKPANGGSSIGVWFVNDQAELDAALERVSAMCRYSLVEKKIMGRELTIGVLGKRTLPAVEIRPVSGFYNYANKYNGSSEEICPAQLSASLANALSDYALRAFSALRLQVYARFDFLLDDCRRLWCLEANTLPGMTPTSLFPMEAATVGISYDALCELLLQLSVKRGKC